MDDLPDMGTTDITKFLPRILIERLKLRELLFPMLIFYFVLNIPLFILGIVFIDSATSSYKYSTYYITDFWDNYTQSNIKNKEIQLLASFSGIFSVCLAIFNLMNIGVIFKHVYKGGLKFRLEVINYLNLILQIILFGYSILPIARHPGFNFLNFILFPMAAIILGYTIWVFIYLRKCLMIESDYLLAMGILYSHKKEYWSEYLGKNNIREMRTDMMRRI
jgi:hypothetical protein